MPTLPPEVLDKFELAFLLHRTLGEIQEMDYDEYLGWQAYFEARPVGWREDNRVMPLLQVKGVKAKASEIFPSMIPILNPRVAPDAEVPYEEGMMKPGALQKSSMFLKMLTAASGDKLPGMESRP